MASSVIVVGVRLTASSDVHCTSSASYCSTLYFGFLGHTTIIILLSTLYMRALLLAYVIDADVSWSATYDHRHSRPQCMGSR